MKCLNRNVLIGLAAVGLGVLVFAPNLLGAALPLLLFAACPLSMVLMMRAMSGSGGQCQTGKATGGAEHDVDVRRLKEEIDRLRAERVPPPAR